ncbi:High affinity cAMP-specific 3',5'-cyclic phosphodiesterase 7A [Dinochytrium kinnereticum]|nr:High affinity cAMP-specific 3',5'-cyclic phosphodiesterase 7A [Dinochytrium kinnereticum]
MLYHFQIVSAFGQSFAPANTSNAQNNGQAVDIKWSAEVTFIVSVLLLSISLFLLQQFVQEYAFNLIDRQNHVTRLSKQNADLQTQLKAMKKDIDLDLDSPITKVIKAIRNIQDKCDLDVDVMESLDYVIQLLSSNQLFMPNLNVNKDAIDSDVKNWLNAMITNHSEVGTQNDKGAISTVPSNAVDAISKPVSNVSDAQIQQLLKSIDTWDFKLFDLVELTNVFERLNLKTQFNLDEGIIQTFLTKIEAGYRPNLYHNSTHAADVLQAVFFFLSTLGMKAMIKPEVVMLRSVVASIIHDLDHPGVNNAYLINSGSSLSIRYNDQSVLENHHCARAFEMMTTDPTCNVLSSLSTDKYKQVRSCILSMVLATDMAGHFEYIAKFKNRLSGSGLQYEDAKDRQLLLDIAIKCGDISNATKSNELCKKWADLIMEEFFRQGDEEKKSGYPVSMFMDRNNTVVSKCQVGFIDYIVSPLYEVWDSFVTEEQQSFSALQNLSKNREYWKRQQELELQKIAVHP